MFTARVNTRPPATRDLVQQRGAHLAPEAAAMARFGEPQAMRQWLADVLDEQGLAYEAGEDLLDRLLDDVSPDVARALVGRGSGPSAAEVLADMAAEAGAQPRRCVLGDCPEADALAQQLERLLPALGIEPAAVIVQIDAHAAEVARRRGTIGVALEGRVYLDPAAFDPTTATGREVLAHELTHVAQWRLGRARGGPPASTAATEIEAATMARVWVGGHTPARPTQPLAPGTYANFAFFGDVIRAFGGRLLDDFAASVAAQLQGTVGQPLVPLLERWSRGELEAPDADASDVADPTLADKAADAIGTAGAEALEAGGKLTLFFLRALFGVMQKLRLLPVGMRVPRDGSWADGAPFRLQLGATANFKTVEMWGRVEVDFAKVHGLFADLMGDTAMPGGEAPVMDAEPDTKKRLVDLLGAKKSKVDPERDVHVVVPWKAPLGGWNVSLPPAVHDGIGGWDRGHIDMRGFVLEQPRLALPSLGDVLVWSAGGERLERVWLEADRLSLGVVNALEHVRTDPGTVDLSVTVPGMQAPIGGLAGVTLSGDVDLGEDAAELSFAFDRAWLALFGCELDLSAGRLAYSADNGPSVDFGAVDLDLAGWFQVHAEALRLDREGFVATLLRIPVPDKVQALLSRLAFIRWSLVAKDGSGGQAGAGVPALALSFHDLRMGPTGYDVTPSLEPDLATHWLSLAIGDVLTIAQLSATLEGLERWLASPTPDAPAARFTMSAALAQLKLFGMGLTLQAANIEVSEADGFVGSLGMGAVTQQLGPIEVGASVAGVTLSAEGFSCGVIQCAFKIGGEVLGKHWRELAVLPTLALSASLADVRYLATGAEQVGERPAGFSAGDATFAIEGVGSVVVPGAFVTELVTKGPAEVDWSSLGLTPAQVATLAASYAAEVVQEKAAEVVQYVVDTATAWWEVIRAWLPDVTSEQPPRMQAEDVLVYRWLGEHRYWAPLKTTLERIDGGIGGVEWLDRRAYDEAKACIVAGALRAGLERLKALAEGEGDAAAVATFETILVGADALAQTLKSDTVASETPALTSTPAEGPLAGAASEQADVDAAAPSEVAPGYRGMQQYTWYRPNGETLAHCTKFEQHPLTKAWHDVIMAFCVAVNTAGDAARTPEEIGAPMDILVAVGGRYDLGAWWSWLNDQARLPAGGRDTKPRVGTISIGVEEDKRSVTLAIALPAEANALDPVAFIPTGISCARASTAALDAAGYDVDTKQQQVIFHAGNEAGGRLDTTKDLTAIRAAAAKALGLIDATLPHPVVVGVTTRATAKQKYNAHNKVAFDKHMYSIADHWMTITQRVGDGRYHYFDPADGSEGDFVRDDNGILSTERYQVQTVRPTVARAGVAPKKVTPMPAPAPTPAPAPAPAPTPNPAPTPAPTLSTSAAASEPWLYERAASYLSSWWYGDGTEEAEPVSAAVEAEVIAPPSPQPTPPPEPQRPPLTLALLDAKQLATAHAYYKKDASHWPADRVALLAEALGLPSQTTIDDAFIQAIAQRQQEYAIPVDGIVGKRGAKSEAEGRSTALLRSLFGEASTEHDQAAASALTAARESGKAKYAAFQTVDSGIVSYGIHQCTVVSGSLGMVIDAYLARAAALSPLSDNAIGLEAYRGRCDRGATNQEALRHDGTFKALLVAAAAEPEMQAAQEAVFEHQYWKPAVGLAESCGMHSPLAYASIYDAAIQHGPDGAEEMIDTTIAKLGGIVGATVDGQTITERDFIIAFNGVRESRLRAQVARDRKKADEIEAAGGDATTLRKNAAMLEHGYERPRGFEALAEADNLALEADDDGTITVAGKAITMPA